MLARHYFYRLAERILRKKNVIITFYTNKGLKNINMGLVANLANPYIIERKEISANDLYLGPDFLVDEYSLLDCSIVQSPHLEFVKTFVEGKEAQNTDYAKRWAAGTLDWRRPMPISISVEEWKKTSALRIEEVMADNYEPIKVYCHDGKYYVYDGKHRAALCHVFGKKVRCEIIPSNYVFDNYCGYMLRRIANNSNYKRHRKFLKMN